ncbi:sulfite exporter TauE/SafE family protein [Catenovulum sp. SM1970]|uniref:sulfite exporter TauE/SafE family protein n=1 Tax=Marinifaba aquimaris TaxID=2741323 RepID=UPI0015719B4F|nr:sulfite exporter TauE/SafE family protein [Marinifaba aquimaris]NTS77153.1 sulfite exporter TauE/SafE family protein [Marinifaba aquimaris]
MEWLLACITLVTSFIAAVVGFGGGMLLIALMPLFVSPQLIIPVHGLTQISSNASRFIFALKDVQWPKVWPFLLGSILGTAFFSSFLLIIPLDYIPIAIGVYLLLNLWSPSFKKQISRFENYYLIGFLQTGLGLIVGATGPLSLTILTKELKDKEQIIATSAVFMTISHLAKIPVFIFISVQLLPHLPIILLMVSAAILGSYLGTRFRLKLDNKTVIKWLKILLTLLALHMIWACFQLL